MSGGHGRREEILQAAAGVFATNGITTSIHQIAAASGILPGSLYHHFESKEAIVIELVTRYQAELDRIAESASSASLGPDATVEERIVGLATAIAECATRNRAAVVLTYFEPPTRSAEELSMLADIDPGSSTRQALVSVLDEARADGFLDPGVSAEPFAAFVWQEMVQAALRVYQPASTDARMPALKCSIMLHGLAARPFDGPRTTSALDAADEAMAGWATEPDPDEDPKRTAIVSAARAEFARRGYQATTMRDVAAAADVSPRSISRAVGSKEDLLVAAMRGYATHVLDGWERIRAVGASPLDTLDAMSWLYVNLLDRFSEERRIQFQSITNAPGSQVESNWAFPTQLRILRDVLGDGMRSGELTSRKAPIALLGSTVFSLLHVPSVILRDLGTEGAFALTRRAVLNGVARRDA
jgi:AcrR family transcriptional regulator